MIRLTVLCLVLCACSADFHAKRGRLALDAHDLPAAELHFRKALQRDSEHLDALSGLGWTYQLAQRPDAARQAFERCHVIDEGASNCIRGLARVAASMGSQHIAIRLVSNALAANPEDPGLQSSMALLEVNQGAVSSAAERYERLVLRYPDRAEYRVGLAAVRLRQDRPVDAARVAETGLALSGAPLRYRAMLLQLQARSLVSATSGRVDARRCVETRPPVMAWLDAADNALDSAEKTGAAPPDLSRVRRTVKQRRAAVEERCPANRLRAESESTG